MREPVSEEEAPTLIVGDTVTEVLPPLPVVALIVVSLPSALLLTLTTVRGLPQLATSPITKIRERILTIVNQYDFVKGLYS